MVTLVKNKEFHVSFPVSIEKIDFFPVLVKLRRPVNIHAFRSQEFGRFPSFVVFIQLSLRKGVLYGTSTQQKLNTKSSTEAEVIEVVNVQM